MDALGAPQSFFLANSQDSTNSQQKTYPLNLHVNVQVLVDKARSREEDQENFRVNSKSEHDEKRCDFRRFEAEGYDENGYYLWGFDKLLNAKKNVEDGVVSEEEWECEDTASQESCPNPIGLYTIRSNEDVCSNNGRDSYTDGHNMSPIHSEDYGKQTAAISKVKELLNKDPFFGKILKKE